MSEIFHYAYVVVSVILLFGAAVFVHEFGHFWMARRRGMKVEAFAIGFGPKIYSWTRDGIEYSIRWIPAGGFVKLPQMVTSEALEGHNQPAEPIPPASPASKILVAVAGPFMNIVFGFALATIIYFAGLPQPINPAIIGYVDPASAEGKMGIKEGSRILAVDGKKVTSWQDVTFRVATATGSIIPVVIAQSGQTNTYQLTAKISDNDAIGLKWLNLDPQEHPVVASVISGSPAEKAGLKTNDRFVSFSGVPVVGQRHLISLIEKRPNQPSELVVLRDKETLTLKVTPRFDPVDKVGRIGAQISESGKVDYELQKPGPLPWESMLDVVEKTYLTLKALIFSSQTGVKAKDLSGPVGIFSILAIQVSIDWRLALSFMVLLNVNLAFLNLLPIPVLDGGHVLMAIVEKIRRRPISARFVEYTTTAFAVLLISFMLYVTFFDLKRFPLIKNMLKRDTQIEQQETPTPAKAPAAENGR